MGKPSSAV